LKKWVYYTPILPKPPGPCYMQGPEKSIKKIGNKKKLKKCGGPTWQATAWPTKLCRGGLRAGSNPAPRAKTCAGQGTRGIGADPPPF
jgi:hypothetical protein